jgi:hypothetical protein
MPEYRASARIHIGGGKDGKERRVIMPGQLFRVDDEIGRHLERRNVVEKPAQREREAREAERQGINSPLEEQRIASREDTKSTAGTDAAAAAADRDRSPNTTRAQSPGADDEL